MATKSKMLGVCQSLAQWPNVLCWLGESLSVGFGMRDFRCPRFPWKSSDGPNLQCVVQGRNTSLVLVIPSEIYRAKK